MGCWEVYRVWHGTGRLQVGRSSPRCVYIDIEISGLAWSVNVNLYIYIHRVWHGTGRLQAGRSSPRSVYIQMYIYRYIWLSPECNRKSIYIHRVWHGTGCLQAGRSSPRTVYIDIYIHTHIHTHIHTYTCSCQLPLWVQLTTTLPGSFYPSEQ